MDLARPELRLRKRRRRWIVFGVLATIAGGTALAVLALDPGMPTVSRDSLLIDTVERGELLRSVRGPGNLVAKQIRWLTAETDAKVERILVQPGGTVTPNTVVMELSNPRVEDDLLAANAAYAAAQSDEVAKRTQLRSDLLESQSTLALVRSEYESALVQEDAERLGLEKGVISAIQYKKSQIELEQLRNRYAIEKQRVAEARSNMDAQLAANSVRVKQFASTRNLRRREVAALKVAAGMDGVLQRVSVEEGQRVSGGANLALVARPDTLMAELRIAETQVRELRPGLRAQVDTRNGIVDGTVRRINPEVSNGTVRVEVELTGKLPAGARADLSVDGVIEIGRLRDVLHVGRPINAQRNSELALFRLAPSGVAERIPVRIGRESVNSVEILGGLREGDQVVLSDMTAYDGQQRIRIK